ncbi:hypothetical protein BOX15_Mlig014458g9 [Macrostomum lignano]|uniref:RNA-directed DNA polymerase n=1 Tax=Macrostomum lignano TaxID=282301 RepID=A0A267GBX3_9PLAT|nr:hypothetical protein BOX15_Mlig014458g9 [Macrostomum lignano]
MAQALQLTAPDAFDIDSDPLTRAQRWKTWARRFNSYIRAAGITDATQQLELLVYTAGEKLEDFMEDNSVQKGKSTNELIQKLQEIFDQKNSVVFLRYQFETCRQEEGESIDAWYHRLRKAADQCEFGELRDSLIRDKVVAHYRSEKIRRELLQLNDICLADVLKRIRAREAAEQQAQAMEENSSGGAAAMTTANVAALGPPRARPSQPFRRDPAMKDGGISCERCGRPGHRTCEAARDKACRRCGKIGHFARACRGTSRIPVRAVNEPDDRSYGQVEYLQDKSTEHELFSLRNSGSAWTQATVNGFKTTLLIDSGAACNIIDREAFERMPQKARLQAASDRVYPYGSQQPLKLLGKTDLQVSVFGCQETLPFLVLDGKGACIIGRRSAEDLGVLRVGPEDKAACELRSECPTDRLLAGVPKDLRQSPGAPSLDEILKENAQAFDGIGCLKNYAARIFLEEGARPVCHPPSRVPIHLAPAVDAELQYLEEQGIIEPVEGPCPWVSRIVVVPKEAPGEIRITQDLMELNKSVVRERHPIPTFEEVTGDMAGATLFSELDVAKAFYQIPVSEECRHLLTFSTPRGLRRLTRLCMGLSTAQEILQAVMSSVLAGLSKVKWIHDDIIVYGHSVAEHHNNLRECLQRLAQHGLTLNPAKCKLARTQVTFMGMRLSKDGVRPTESKLEAVNAFAEPTNVTEVRSFLGLVNYLAAFTPRLADLAKPLRNLTRKGQPWAWADLERQAFSDIKSQIASSGSLAFFNHRLPTQLIVDAGPAGLGAILSQTQSDGTRRPIAYASRTLSNVEQRYSQTEKEALAVKFGCLKFQFYLHGAPMFTVQTDHKPLVALFGSSSRPPPRIERMALRIQHMKFTVEYQPGPLNPADVLSRQPLPTPAPNVGEELDALSIAAVVQAAVPNALSLTSVQNSSQKDATIQAAIRALETGRWSLESAELRSLHALRHELSAVDGVLLRGQRIIVPVALRRLVLDLAHRGHQCTRKTLDRLNTKVWWPRMQLETERFIATCRACLATSHAADVTASPLKPTPIPKAAWLTLGADLLGPIQGSMLLVCVDQYSRFPEVEVVQTTTAEALIPRLRSSFVRFGIPQTLVTDNGPPFSSAQFKSFLDSYGIRQRLITPLHPQANGATERLNRSINKVVRAAIAQKRDWRAALDEWLLAYRCTPQRTTGRAPAELLMGRVLNDSIPSVRPSRPVAIADRQLRQRDALRKAQGKLYTDRKRLARPHKLKVGDTVLRRRLNPLKGDTPFEWDPWLIEEIKADSATIRQGARVCRRHCTDLKRVAPESEPDNLGELAAMPQPEVNAPPPQPAAGERAASPIALRPHPRAAKVNVNYKA